MQVQLGYSSVRGTERCLWFQILTHSFDLILGFISQSHESSLARCTIGDLWCHGGSGERWWKRCVLICEKLRGKLQIDVLVDAYRVREAGTLINILCILAYKIARGRYSKATPSHVRCVALRSTAAYMDYFPPPRIFCFALPCSKT